LRIELLVSSDFKPWLNYLFSGGYVWKLSNNNLLKINLPANYTSFNLARGDYEINVKGQQTSSGIYHSRLSGIGISAHYILTSSRKNLVKEYKKSLKKQGL